MLGTFAVDSRGEKPDNFESNKARALLAYLVIEAAHTHSRDKLAGLLWPDIADRVALKNLRQALSNLRKVIGDTHASPPFLIVTRQHIGINPECKIWSDVGEFSRLIKEAENHPHRQADRCPLCAERLRQAVALYRGDFLAGLYIRESNSFDEWLFIIRERLRRQCILALQTLTTYHQQRGETALALKYAHRLLDIDPWREETHRQVMRLLALDGQRSAALAQFERCKRILTREFNVEPEAATLELQRAIRENRLSPPPLPTHNLPPDQDIFIGRQPEIAAILECLCTPTCRLLTITGPGGVGKSRLALHAARQLRFVFADGVCYLSLAEIEEEEHIAPALADRLGLQTKENTPPLDQIAAFLKEKELLLLLDNAEHLPACADIINHILRQTDHTAFLVTSRHPLRLRAEHILRLQGLPVPEAKPEDSQASLSPAVELFYARAQQHDITFEPTAEIAQTVAQIARLTEGLPLALELAAAWVGLRPLKDVSASLADGLESLTSQMRDATQRHHSVRAAFEHSWNYLPPAEQAVFPRLSVFRGVFSLQAAIEVAEATPEILSSLITHSMVQLQGEERFRLHPLLRRWGEEKLQQNAAHYDMRRNLHSRHYLKWLSSCTPQLRSGRQRATLDAIALALENVRAAWDWAVQQLDVETLKASADALALFYETRNRVQEGQLAFRSLTERLQSLAARDKEQQRLLSRALAYQGYFCILLSEYDEAHHLLQTGLDIATQSNDLKSKALAIKGLSELAIRTDEYNAVLSLSKEGLSIAMQLADNTLQSNFLTRLGIITLYLGEYSAARDWLQQGLKIARQQNDPDTLAIISHNLANVDYAEGNAEKALEHSQQALAYARQINDQILIARILNMQGVFAGELGDLNTAIQAQEESITILRSLGDQHGLMISLATLGALHYQQGNLSQCKEITHQAIALARELQNEYFHGYATYTLGAVALDEEKYDTAKRYFNQSRQILHKIGDDRGIAGAMAAEARVEIARGEETSAANLLAQSLLTAHKINATPMVCDAVTAFGELFLKRGDTKRAFQCLNLSISHPATPQYIRKRARDLLADLRAEFPNDDELPLPEDLNAALKETVESLLAEFPPPP